jgi:hypothetical protein
MAANASQPDTRSQPPLAFGDGPSVASALPKAQRLTSITAPEPASH